MSVLADLSTVPAPVPLLADPTTRDTYLRAELDRIVTDYSRPAHGTSPDTVRARIAALTAPWGQEGHSNG